MYLLLDFIVLLHILLQVTTDTANAYLKLKSRFNSKTVQKHVIPIVFDKNDHMIMEKSVSAKRFLQ